MVEEHQVDGYGGGGGDFLVVFVCGDGMWVAGLGEVCGLSCLYSLRFMLVFVSSHSSIY